MAKNEKIIGLIRALMSKTVENGCTEQEALEASRKAAELLRKYQLSLTDVELGQEAIETSQWKMPSKKVHEVRYTLESIERYTNTIIFTSRARGEEKFDWGETTIEVFGLYSDAVLAKYMVEVFYTAMERAWNEYRVLPEVVGKARGARRPFMVAMAGRISERVSSMAYELRKQGTKTATGTDLVLVKDAYVKEAFKKTGIELGESRRDVFNSNEHADNAGRIAGDKVHIGTAVNGEDEVIMIGA